MKKLRLTRARIAKLSQVEGGAAVGSEYALFQGTPGDGEGLSTAPVAQDFSDELAEEYARQMGFPGWCAFQETLYDSKSPDEVTAAVDAFAQYLKDTLIVGDPNGDSDGPVEGMAQGQSQTEPITQENSTMDVTMLTASGQATEPVEGTLTFSGSRKFSTLSGLWQAIGVGDKAAAPVTPAEPVATEPVNPAPVAQTEPAAPVAEATPETPAAPVAQAAPETPASASAPAVTEEPTAPVAQGTPALDPNTLAILEAMKSVIAPIAQGMTQLQAENQALVQRLATLERTQPAPGSRQPDAEATPVAQAQPRERVKFADMPFPRSLPR